MSDAIHMGTMVWSGNIHRQLGHQRHRTWCIYKRGAYTQHLAAWERIAHTDLTNFM